MTTAFGGINCTSCRTKNTLSARFCKNCGRAVAIESCGHCGARLKSSAKFCTNCGKGHQTDTQQWPTYENIRLSVIQHLVPALKLAWETRTAKIVTSTIAALVAIIFVGLLFFRSSGNEKIVWNTAGSGAWACQDISCLENEMRTGGASSAAIAFARTLSEARHQPAWVTAVYKEGGKIKVVAYNCASCRIGSFAIIDGVPGLVLSNVAISVAENSSVFQQYLATHSGFFLSSMSERFVGKDILPNGGERFKFLNGIAQCEACATSDAIEYAFDFDAGGNSLGITILGIVPFDSSAIGPPGN